MGLFRRASAASSLYDDEWFAPEQVHEHFDGLLRCWSGQHGHTWSEPLGPRRSFGTCEGVHEGVRFVLRGVEAHDGVGIRFHTEAWAWVPGQGASIRHLERSREGGPYEPDRLASLYRGDVGALGVRATEALLSAAPYATVLRLVRTDPFGHRAPGGVVHVSPWDPRLHPGTIEWAGLDLLLGLAVCVARSLAS